MNMSIKKLAPWNWFRDEESNQNRNQPVSAQEPYPASSLVEFHREMDQLFDRAWNTFLGSFNGGRSGLPESPTGAVMLKPSVDIAATDDQYRITVEVPGVAEKDVKLELQDDMLIVRGSKQRETGDDGEDFVRVERSYGSFQRILSLPEDADRDGISASFANGVLSITMPRKAAAGRKRETVDIRSVA